MEVQKLPPTGLLQSQPKASSQHSTNAGICVSKEQNINKVDHSFLNVVSNIEDTTMADSSESTPTMSLKTNSSSRSKIWRDEGKIG
jgi:hypothetical protein